jgi:transposase-like protein
MTRVPSGLADPVLVVTDGAPGLIQAVEECLPRAQRQCCLAHKLRNLETNVPAERWREVKAMALAAYHASSPKTAEWAGEEFRHTYAHELPSSVKCFEDDFAACIDYLRLPVAHRRATRTTNVLERLFLEERRRRKTIPHTFGERAVLKLMYAALERASRTISSESNCAHSGKTWTASSMTHIEWLNRHPAHQFPANGGLDP